MTVDNKSWRKKLSHWERGKGEKGEGEPEFPVKSQTTHWGQEGVVGEGQNWT